MEDIASKLPDDVKKIVGEMKEAMSKGLNNAPGYKEPGWRGYRFSLFFDSDAAKMAYEDFEFPENTVILSSFPKTGTNWISEILRQMLFGSDPKLDAITSSIPPLFYVLEGFSGEKMKIWDHILLPRTFFLSHLPAPLINMEKVKKSKSKIIVPVRNPKDQAVSWYNFSKGEGFEPIREYINPEWNQFILDYIQGKQPMPVTKPGEGYAEFLLGWHEYKDDPDVLFVGFEDMKKDAAKEIRRIAKFIGIELTDEQVRLVKEKSSFDHMKAQQHAEVDAIAKMRKQMHLVRAGKVGSWKDVFTVAQSEMMDEMMEKKLAGTGIKFSY